LRTVVGSTKPLIRGDCAMRENLRRHRRVGLNYMARVMSLRAETICDCAIIDVSEGGARIAVLATEMVPDEFLLAFAPTSNVSRKCKVAWRRDDEIGLIFHKASEVAAAQRMARRARLLETPCP
jgi:hypothetical protein